MRQRVIRWLYERSGPGPRYWRVMAAAQALAAVLVASLTLGISGRFFRVPPATVIASIGIEACLASVAVVIATSAIRPRLVRFHRWADDPHPEAAETAAVWALVVDGPADIYRRYAPWTIAVSLIPIVVISAAWWRIGLNGVLAELVACIAPIYYGTAVAYSISELVGRPMAEDIAHRMPDVDVFRSGLSVSRRLKIAVPAYTTVATTLTIAVLGLAHGAAALALTSVTAIVIGAVLSTELTVLLSDSVTGPIRRLQHGLSSVQRGDFDARAEVLTSDEFGELASTFNDMTRGLADRERIREALGTYIDASVADLILSGDIDPRGAETTVSILFCDVRGFTAWAEARDATTVLDALNTLFAQVVPIVTEHGGYVDKFLGDGLLAVFGAPRPLADHADQATAAAREIVEAVERLDTPLKVACGINTGPVVAGPLGGAGRLNFSVIGDAVNVAARVEAATRQTGDDVLLTEATRSAHRHPHALEPRGRFTLKGKTTPVRLYAAVPAGGSTRRRGPVRPLLSASRRLRRHHWL